MKKMFITKEERKAMRERWTKMIAEMHEKLDTCAKDLEEMREEIAEIKRIMNK